MPKKCTLKNKKITNIEYKNRNKEGKLLLKKKRSLDFGLKVQINTWNLNAYLLTITYVFLNQKRINVHEHTERWRHMIIFIIDQFKKN